MYKINNNNYNSSCLFIEVKIEKNKDKNNKKNLYGNKMMIIMRSQINNNIDKNNFVDDMINN